MENQKVQSRTFVNEAKPDGILPAVTRLAVVAIIVEELSAAPKINELLSLYGDCIVGRMGLPYHAKNVSVISVVLDAPQESINSLTGKLGMIKGASAKTLFAKI